MGPESQLIALTSVPCIPPRLLAKRTQRLLFRPLILFQGSIPGGQLPGHTQTPGRAVKETIAGESHLELMTILQRPKRLGYFGPKGPKDANSRCMYVCVWRYNSVDIYIYIYLYTCQHVLLQLRAISKVLPKRAHPLVFERRVQGFQGFCCKEAEGLRFQALSNRGGGLRVSRQAPTGSHTMAEFSQRILVCCCPKVRCMSSFMRVLRRGQKWTSNPIPIDV